MIITCYELKKSSPQYNFDSPCINIITAVSGDSHCVNTFQNISWVLSWVIFRVICEFLNRAIFYFSHFSTCKCKVSCQLIISPFSSTKRTYSTNFQIDFNEPFMYVKRFNQENILVCFVNYSTILIEPFLKLEFAYYFDVKRLSFGQRPSQTRTRCNEICYGKIA